MLSITHKIHTALTGKKTVDFTLDKETMDKIGAIVMQIVELLKGCKKTPEQATVSVRNPGANDKKLVRKAVRKELGFFKNLFQGDRYYEAVMAGGKEATLADVTEAYAA